MAHDSKYAALLDIDNAPDIYETPDLIDDTSTLQTATTARSSSPTNSDTSDSTSVTGINRRRLHPDRARTHFLPSRVDAREADFSDRVSSKRKSYRVSSRRRRRDGTVIEHEGEDEDEWSGEDEEEGLERRLARLRREVQEVQADFERRKQETLQDGADDGGASQEADYTAAGVGDLSRALDALRATQREDGGAHAQLARRLARAPPQQEPDLDSRPASSPRKDTLQADQTDAHTLTRIADFDARLASLEHALGMTSLDLSTSTNTTMTPILPTLALLDTQVQLLASTDTDALTQRLTQATRAAQAAAATSQSSVSSGDAAATESVTAVALTPEDVTKLHALYALLPALSSMAPTLPPLLTRLRSLRMLHASAAGANHVLEEVERRQREMGTEIEAWREGLEKVERAVSGAEQGMRENSGAVEQWVKELEARVRKLDM